MSTIIGKGVKILYRQDGSRQYTAFVEYRHKFLGISYKEKKFLSAGPFSIRTLSNENDNYNSIIKFNTEEEAIEDLECYIREEEEYKRWKENQKVIEHETKYYWP